MQAKINGGSWKGRGAVRPITSQWKMISEKRPQRNGQTNKKGAEIEGWRFWAELLREVGNKHGWHGSRGRERRKERRRGEREWVMVTFSPCRDHQKRASWMWGWRTLPYRRWRTQQTKSLCIVKGTHRDVFHQTQKTDKKHFYFSFHLPLPSSLFHKIKTW